MDNRCKEKLLEKQVCRGILQSSKLSSLLFVLCMNPLNRKSNSKYQMIKVKCRDVFHTYNLLFFDDDLKLLATSHTNLKLLLDKAFSFHQVVLIEHFFLRITKLTSILELLKIKEVLHLKSR